MTIQKIIDNMVFAAAMPSTVEVTPEEQAMSSEEFAEAMVKRSERLDSEQGS